MLSGFSDYVVGKFLGACIGFVFISLIFIPTSYREGFVRFAVFYSLSNHFHRTRITLF